MTEVNSISGDSGDNVLKGEAGVSNNIAGNDGDDIIIGRGKDDLLLGGKGDDTMFGGNGHDIMFGGAGDDTLKGGNGADILQGDKGDNDLYGGNGDDTFVINVAIAGQGYDTIHDFDVNRALRSMNFNDTLEFKNVSGEQFTFQQVGDDTLIFIDGIEVAKLLDVDAADVLRATEFTGGTPSSVSLLDEDGEPIRLTISGTPGDDTLAGIPGIDNTIAGNSGDDTISGQGKDDFLLGGPGDDTLIGRNGSDTLLGGGDDDTLSGGNGGDLLNGNAGSDTLTGGNGADEFAFNVTQGVDTVTDFDLSEGDTLTFNRPTSEITATDDGSGNTVLSFAGTDFAIIEGVDAATLETEYGFL